jgi:hypothetical protein
MFTGELQIFREGMSNTAQPTADSPFLMGFA